MLFLGLDEFYYPWMCFYLYHKNKRKKICSQCESIQRWQTRHDRKTTTMYNHCNFLCFHRRLNFYKSLNVSSQSLSNNSFNWKLISYFSKQHKCKTKKRVIWGQTRILLQGFTSLSVNFKQAVDSRMDIKW